ncbi:MAG: hypothetical protein HY074_09520 [Deltaproteobacteria bacterium]|nr:hypothetical protein [Deltaproteobacteria bacterium]
MRQAFRRVVTALAFFMVLGMAENIACSNAEAYYGFNDALGTIGIAAGIGAVMGLSTISFYDSPTKHLSNTLVGAGAGLIVGLGVAAYLMANAAESDEINPDELLPPENKPEAPGKTPGKDPAKSEKKAPTSIRSVPRSLLLASVPTTLMLRDSTNWMIAFQVLELRF